jgi:signal transduction histidine kinase
MAAAPQSFAQDASAPSTVLTNLDQVHDLGLTKGAKGIPVSLQPVVTYMDPEWRMCFVQDASGSAYVERTVPSSDSSWNLPLGQRVQLDGVTSRGIIQCNVRENKLQLLGRGSLPKPQILGSDESFKSMSDATWVRASGVITGVRTAGSKMDLDLRLNRHRSVRALILGGLTSSGGPLVGTMAEVTGVFGLDLDSNNKPTGKYMIWVQSPSLVQLNGPLPTTPISDLTGPEPDLSRDGLVHVRGNIVNQSPDFLFVRDDTGTIRVEYKSPVFFGNGSPVEIFGYVQRQNSAAVLEDALISTPNADSGGNGISIAHLPTSANTNLPTLTQALQVRDLPAKLAAKSYPVHLRGVVTYLDPAGGLQFVQDGTGGIFIDAQVTHVAPFPEARQMVDVKGFSAPGDFAPVVEVETVQSVGKGNYPEPLSAPMQVLMTGAEDSQWVTLNGVVRGQSVTNNTTVLSMATGDSVMDVIVPNEGDHPAPHSFIDAWIEVQGVCGTIFDTDRSLTGVHLFVPGWDQIQVWTPGENDPFALPVRSISALLEFHAGASGLHRSHVRGTVLARRLDGSFYLQDDTGGVLIQPQKSVVVRPGDAVELVGFPSVIDKLPVLQEAVVRPLRQTPAPHVTKITADTPFSQKMNGTLTRFEARVIEHSSSSSQESLMVQFGPWITDVILEKDQPDDQFARIEPGSIVELTGVYLARLDDNHKVQSFQLLCRNPADVRVLSQPSWWTARRVGWLLAGLAVTLGLALGWVTSLHRQVNQRTRELRAEIEERKRIEARVEEAHKQLLETSRLAGMAEVATDVLHNVGNVLNSVNVACSLVIDRVKASKVSGLSKISALLEENRSRLGEFLTTDPHGTQIPHYLKTLAEYFDSEQSLQLKELSQLAKHIDHIKQIVVMQQNYARVAGVLEMVNPSQLLEDALHINNAALIRHSVQVERKYEETPLISTDKHKVLQILVNLIRNAKYALDESKQMDKLMTLTAGKDGNGWVKIQVIDNGVGIPRENLARIFGHGFTTRRNGHGFGLHSGALAIKQLGGSISAQSDGPGKGAVFTLLLPLNVPARSEAEPNPEPMSVPVAVPEPCQIETL